MNSNVRKKTTWHQSFTDFLLACHFEETSYMVFDRIENYKTKHRVQVIGQELTYSTALYKSAIMDFGPFQRIMTLNTYLNVNTALVILTGVRAIDLESLPELNKSHAFA